MVSVFLTGCAAVYYPDSTAALVDQGRGSYHVVAEGETLWAISQAYHVDVDQLILLNTIADAASIRKGQKIFIPGSYRTSYRNASAEGLSKTATSRETAFREEFRKEDFSWPFRGALLSSFHGRDAGFWDQGIRIKAPSGSQISAARQGKVVFVDELSGYGHTVILDHMDGFMSVYAGGVHPVVILGDTVHKGDMVAVSPAGESGFLYFEIRRHGAAANPLFYLPKS